MSHLSEWLSSINQQTTSAGEDVEKRKQSCTFGENADCCSYLWKAVWRYLKKLKMDLRFDLALRILEVYPKESKTLIQKNISTSMFFAALLIYNGQDMAAAKVTIG